METPIMRRLVRWLLRDVLDKLAIITEQGKKIMLTEQDILDKVTAEKTVDDSILALIGTLSQQIKDAGTDPVKLQAISDMLDSRDAAFTAAVTANTPPAPPAA